MAEFDSGVGISTGRPRFTYTCVQCDRPWTTTVPPHENPRCPRCAAVEIERHKAVLRDKPPQPRFDTCEDWVRHVEQDYRRRVAEAERRNRARKIREAKAAIRAAHAKLAELRSTPIHKPGLRPRDPGPPVRDNPGQDFADAVAYGLGAYRAPPVAVGYDAGRVNPTPRRPTAVGQRVVHRLPNTAPRTGTVRKLRPALGPFEAAAYVRFDDLPDTPDHLVRLPTASLELIG